MMSRAKFSRGLRLHFFAAALTLGLAACAPQNTVDRSPPGNGPVAPAVSTAGDSSAHGPVRNSSNSINITGLMKDPRAVAAPAQKSTTKTTLERTCSHENPTTKRQESYFESEAGFGQCAGSPRATMGNGARVSTKL